jgi:hypothetical protein
VDLLTEGDAFGMLLTDGLEHDDAAVEITERDDGFIAASACSHYFALFKEQRMNGNPEPAQTTQQTGPTYDESLEPLLPDRDAGRRRDGRRDLDR